MEDNTIILIIFGFVVFCLILYTIIKNAVSAAARDENISIQNRLLIKLLEERGVPKKDIMDLCNADKKKFWESIKE